MNNTLFKLKPAFLKKIWGWEKWLLSCYGENDSIVITSNKTFKALSLKELLGNLGYGHKFIKKFPLLIKIIKTYKALSIQVHPNDKQAFKKKSLGKDECWYILEAGLDSFVYLNFKKKVNAFQIKEHIKNNTLEEIMNKVKVKVGDFINIPAGTVHAIGKEIILLEIQQSSDITYRLYDYGRDRELHLKDGLAVIDYKNLTKKRQRENFKRFNSPYFFLEKKILNGEEFYLKKNQADFFAFFVVNGEINVKEQGIPLAINPNLLSINFKKYELGLAFMNEQSYKITTNTPISEVILVKPNY